MNRPAPKIVLILLGVMAAIHVVQSAGPPHWNNAIVVSFGCSLFFDGQFVAERLYTTATAIFLHADWGHLIANGISLLIFGMFVHPPLGDRRFLLLFLLTGVVGNLTHAVLNASVPSIVIGASGSVFGLLGAGAYVLTRNREGGPPRPINILHYVLVIAALMAGYTLLGVGGNVSWEGHAGGFVAGLLLYPFLRPRPRPPMTWSGPN